MKMANDQGRDRGLRFSCIKLSRCFKAASLVFKLEKKTFSINSRAQQIPGFIIRKLPVGKTCEMSIYQCASIQVMTCR